MIGAGRLDRVLDTGIRGGQTWESCRVFGAEDPANTIIARVFSGNLRHKSISKARDSVVLHVM